MSLRLHHHLLGGPPGDFTDFSQYIGGQLKIQVIRRATLRSAGLYDRRVHVLRGEIEDIFVNGLEVEVRLAWLAETHAGPYTAVRSFDPVVSFHVCSIRSDFYKDCELITEQNESMVFYERDNERLVPVTKIKEPSLRTRVAPPVAAAEPKDVWQFKASSVTTAIPGPVTTCEPRVTYWHMDWHPRTNLQGENRTVTLNLVLPHDTFLRLLATPGQQIVEFAARYFISAAESRFEDVLQYLRTFFTRLQRECAPYSDMRALPEYRGTAFDFPRPSPTWLMVEMFCNALRPQRPLCEQLHAAGARFF